MTAMAAVVLSLECLPKQISQSVHLLWDQKSDKHVSFFFFFHILSIKKKIVCFYVGRVLEYVPYFAQGIF